MTVTYDRDSALLWKDAPSFNEMFLKPATWGYYFQDFNADSFRWESAVATMGGIVYQSWKLAQATSAGTVRPSVTGPSSIIINSGATTADYGVTSFQQKGVLYAVQAAKSVWYEARIKVIGGFDVAQLFVGLGPVDTAIFSAGARNLVNNIGFWADDAQASANAGYLYFDCADASTHNRTLAAALMVTDTWIRLGFKVVGVTSVTPFVDGVAGTELTSNLPIATTDMKLSFACLCNDGTNQPIMEVDWVKAIWEK